MAVATPIIFPNRGALFMSHFFHPTGKVTIECASIAAINGISRKTFSGSMVFSFPREYQRAGVSIERTPTLFVCEVRYPTNI